MQKQLYSFLFPAIESTQSAGKELAYALFRIYCGISIAYGAGFSKVFHKIDEKGTKDWSNLEFGAPQWFIEQVEQIGFTFISPTFWAYLAIYGEFIGGILIALGLFTRFSALQMAFQFFVVSFIWYNEPMPFAMYYQQLIFWGFFLIAAFGSGRYSVDALLEGRRFRMSAGAQKLAMTSLLISVFSVSGFSQVPFTVKNGSLKTISVEIKHFEAKTQKTTGYGLELGPLQSEAINMPVGTRIYRDGIGLIMLIDAEQKGAEINLAGKFAPSREAYLQAAYDEMLEEAYAKAEPSESVSELAAQYGLPLIPVSFKGKSLVPRLTHVRVEFPFSRPEDTNGFSQELSAFSEKHVVYPVGTRVYLCDGPFWSQPANQVLLFVVDEEKANYQFKI